MSRYLPIYEWAARTQGLEADLLEALAVVHTGEDPETRRYGAGERRFWRQAMLRASLWADKAPSVVAARWGLLAVPYHAAVQMGLPLDDDPRALYDPWAGVHYGARWLSCLIARHHGSVSAGIAAYQSSWGRARVRGGRFENWRHVQRVTRHLERIREEHRPAQMPAMTIC